MRDKVTPLLKDILGTTTKIAAWIKVVAIILFIMCVVMSFHYLFINFPRKAEIDNLSFDYVGMLIGFYGILITLLVGWQIYSTIKAKQEIAEAKELVEKQFENKLNKLENCCNEQKEEIKDINRKIDTVTDNLKQQIENNLIEGRMYAKSLSEVGKARMYLAIFQLYILLEMNYKNAGHKLPSKTDMLDKSLSCIAKSLSFIDNYSLTDSNKNEAYALLFTIIGVIEDYSQQGNISSATIDNIINVIANDNMPTSIGTKDKLIERLNKMIIK